MERPTKDRAHLLLCEAGTLRWLHVDHISVKVFDHDQTELCTQVGRYYDAGKAINLMYVYAYRLLATS